MLSADELSKLPAGTTVTMMTMVIPPKPPVSQQLLLPPPAPLNLPNTSAFSCSSPEFIDLDRVNLTASSECGSARLAEEDPAAPCKKSVTEMLYEVLRTSLRVPDGSYGPY